MGICKRPACRDDLRAETKPRISLNHLSIFLMEPRLSGTSPRMGSVRAPPIERTPAWPLQQSTDLGSGRLRRLLMGSQPRHCAAPSRGSHQRCKVRATTKHIRLSMLQHCYCGPRIRLACHAALPARGALPDRSEDATGRTACLRDRVGCPAFVLAYPRSLRAERVRAPPITRPQGCVRRWVTRFGRRALRAWTC